MNAQAVESALALTAPPPQPHLGALIGIALSLLVEALAHIGIAGCVVVAIGLLLLAGYRASAEVSQ